MTPELHAAHWYARRGRIREILAVCAALATSAAYGAVTVGTNGGTVVAIVLLGSLFTALVFARPAAGVYLAVSAALLLEQWNVPGIDPITAQTHFFDNVSSFTNLDLRLSPSDLLIATCVLAWLIRRDGRSQPLTLGPLGWAIGAYGITFVAGLGVGMARGGEWNMVAALAELRGPLYVCALYFLTANLIRTRQQLMGLALLFGALVGVKALQAIVNTDLMLSAGLRLDAVTSHEDVIFFDVALVLALAAGVLVGRGRLTYLLVGMVPAIVLAELLTQRRVAFIALAAVFVVIAQQLFVARRRTMFAICGVALLTSVAYGAVFWNASGVFAQPVRAVKSIVAPGAVSERDRLSNYWRDLENLNIAYTLRQVPVTGVGLGQQYLFLSEPPALTGFTYWRYMTHNAIFWVWLKAGLLGFVALWAIFSITLIESARSFRLLADPQLKVLALMPAALVVVQYVYSGVDLGLTYSRPMIVLGAVLGTTAALAAIAGAPAHVPVALRTRAQLVLRRVYLGGSR